LQSPYSIIFVSIKGPDYEVVSIQKENAEALKKYITRLK